MKPFQKQVGGGVFAIAAVTALALNIDPSTVRFKQEDIRPHLVTSFKNQKFTLFLDED